MKLFQNYLLSIMATQLESNHFERYFQAKCPWINKFLFEQLIQRENSNQNVIVEKYSLEVAVPKGENFASEVIRAKVDYTVENYSQKQINFVIKVQKSIDKSFKENEMFLREIAVFRDVIPRAEKLLRSIDDDTKLSAKCYQTNGDKFYLILEDLSVTGYRNLDKKIGLTIDSYKLTFSTLAKWHATTAVLFQSEPEIMKSFTDIFHTEYQDIVHESVIKTLAKLTCTKPEFKYVGEKLEKLVSTISLKINESLKRCPNEFNCLNHNDLWTNNIMFNESTNNALLIDFQRAYLGSPAIDICKSFFKSSHNAVRTRELDELLVYYHNELSSTLLKLNFNNIPTLHHLKIQIKDRGISAITSGLFGTVSRYVEDVDLEYEKLFADRSHVKMINMDVFTNPDAHDKLWFLIKYFDKMGYFES